MILQFDSISMRAKILTRVKTAIREILIFLEDDTISLKTTRIGIYSRQIIALSFKVLVFTMIELYPKGNRDRWWYYIFGVQRLQRSSICSLLPPPLQVSKTCTCRIREYSETFASPYVVEQRAPRILQRMRIEAILVGRNH